MLTWFETLEGGFEVVPNDRIWGQETWSGAYAGHERKTGKLPQALLMPRNLALEAEEQKRNDVETQKDEVRRTKKTD
jgi:hypothetical protein